MKNLYFILISMLMSASAFSQSSAHSLMVINQTNCYQYFQIHGGDICNCTPTLSGSIISIAPGATLFYANSTTLGGTFPTSSPRGMVLARIINGPLYCNISTGLIGQMACSLPSSHSFVTLNANCSPCGSTTATWTPSPNCTTTAKLTFTP